MFDEFINSAFIDNLPATLYGFNLKRVFAPVKASTPNKPDDFDFVYYLDEERFRSVRLYFHTDTNQFRILLSVGLNSYAVAQFLTSDWKRFLRTLETKLDLVLQRMDDFVDRNDEFLLEKDLHHWDYGLNLPQIMEGFRLIVSPQRPFHFTNGCYVLLNYFDPTLRSDFVVYYSYLRDDFGAELRLRGVPRVLKEFDLKPLKMLDAKLQQELGPRLQALRSEVVEGGALKGETFS